MAKVAVVGGGFAGCGAAAAAARAGVEVTLIERADSLGGLGLAGGSSRMNGQYTAHEEAITMGAGDIFKVMDAETMFVNIELPGQRHVNMYNCQTIAKRFDQTLRDLRVEIKYRTRINKVSMSGDEIESVISEDGEEIEADSFVDTTGTWGPQANCGKYGNGCTTCLMRCPTFGGRVSIADKAGVKEWVGVKHDGSPGTQCAAFTLLKESLSTKIQKELEQNGCAVLKIPKQIVPGLYEKLKLVAPAVTPEHAEELTLTYMGKGTIGWVNIVGLPYMTFEELHAVPGFENVAFIQPFTGWIGNAIRYMSVTPRDKMLKANGVENLFVAGEKMGGQPNGVTEAATTGALAGHNAARKASGMKPLELSRDTVIGDFVAYTAEHQQELNVRHSYIWGVYFERMKQTGLYTKDVQQIKNRVEKAGLTGIFSKKLTGRA
jgi:hypothetical protein